METGATSGVSSGRFSEGLTVTDIQEITLQKGRFREIVGLKLKFKVLSSPNSLKIKAKEEKLK